MLPSTGCFRSIDCPYHGNSCTRPYCHFKHKQKKRVQERPETVPATAEESIPTYKPTPKSQLQSARSHIPISYVPNLISRSERTAQKLSTFGSGSAPPPIYNPTPLSILSSSSKLNTLVSDSIEPTPPTEESKKTASDDNNDEAYVPVSKAGNEEESVAYIPTAKDAATNDDEISLNDLSNELNAIDEKLDDCQTNKRETKSHENGAQLKKDEAKNESKKVGKVRSKEAKSSDGAKSKKSEHKSKSNKSSSSEKGKSEKSSSKTSNSSSSTSKTTTSKTKERKSSKHDKHKSKDKERHDSKTKHHSKEKHSSGRKSKHKDTEPVHVKKEIKQEKCDGTATTKTETLVKIKEEKMDDDDDNNDNDHFDAASIGDYDSDESDAEESSLMECYKIFNEYHAAQPAQLPPAQHTTEPSPSSVEEALEERPPSTTTTTGKKRIAHENADKFLPAKRTVLNRPRAGLTPAQIMNNRFKLAVMGRASNEQRDIAHEINVHAQKRPLDPPATTSASSKIQRLVVKATEKSAGAPPKTTPAATKPNTSLVDDIINGRARWKKIAPVTNVNLFQQAKAKIDQMCKPRTDTTTKTPIQTIGKHAKRTAHVPDTPTVDVPDLIGVEKSKLPVNVRARFLSMLTNECIKLYVSKEDAYQRAQTEEYKCFERCQVLVTYKNSAMLAVSRIRKELQERNAAGLGQLLPGERPVKSGDASSEFRGKRFYENIKGYVLTDDELEQHGYPREGSTHGKAIVRETRSQPVIANLRAHERRCARCSKVYKVDRKGFALNPEECSYHALKKRTFRGESFYLCCKSTEDTGCAISNTHVCDNANVGNGGELEGYQMTMPSERDDDPRDTDVYALDCEMCYTTRGLELTRVTIVNADCKTVYETLVKPLNPIIDYNTKFSGITKEQMDRTATNILQVQANILHLCSAKTILIGHSLESDMKALKIIHSNVIDTSVMFPHKMGLPHKRALRTLASEYLNKIIQNGIGGHDSAEDALACMELVIWKLKEELKIRGIKS